MKKYSDNMSFLKNTTTFSMILFLNVIASKGYSQEAAGSGSYLQEIRTDITLPEPAGREHRNAAFQNGTAILIYTIQDQMFFSEDDGAFFLLPYWMGRYHSLLIEKQ